MVELAILSIANDFFQYILYYHTSTQSVFNQSMLYFLFLLIFLFIILKFGLSSVEIVTPTFVLRQRLV